MTSNFGSLLNQSKNYHMIKIKLLIMLLAMGVLPVAGQDFVQRQLLKHSLDLTNQGYTISHDVSYDFLRQGEFKFYTTNLKRGVEYKILSVCDGDCGDIDLKLYDENNKVVSEDLGTDDIPIVSCKPRWSGQFKIYVKMYECSLNPCKFGLVVYSK
jgi:hypothetical protein